jgi:hypothetical protein
MTLVYARARWYDPVLATFTSEDPLVGETADPPSRHLYAYGAGDPMDRIDPDGLFWYKVRSGDTLAGIAGAWLGGQSAWPVIRWANYPLVSSDYRIYPGECLWLSRWVDPSRRCTPTAGSRPWPYWRSKMITRYMAQEMTSNCQYACSRWGSWDTRGGVTNALILANFGWKVRNGAPWDHKQKIRNLTLSYESGFYTPLAGLDAAIYFDVWSNIHYGYVGRWLRIPQNILMLAQFDPRDRSDDATVRLGMRMAERNDICAVTEDELRRTVVAWKTEFREAGKLRSATQYRY